ncbi:MAG: carboxypeptidase M32 [bacterium]
MAHLRKSYEELKTRMSEVAALETIRWVLDWDEQTALQPAGAPWRGRQTALIDGLSHERATDSRIDELLAELEAAGDDLGVPESAERVNLREWRRDYDRRVKLPKSLVEEIARTTVEARAVWVEARKNNRFSDFAPWLEKNFKLAREAADHYGHDGEPYDALLAGYEPGITAAQAGEMLRDLRTRLVPMIEAVAGAERHPDRANLRGTFPVSVQQAFNMDAVSWIGYDPKRGGIGETAHPFSTTLGPNDVRFGTRYSEEDFSDALTSSLHEAGHSIYEQGLPSEHFGTPLGSIVSLGIHESQSRMWENRIGRSHAFWEVWLPRACNYFPELSGRNLDAVHFAINDIKPSLIRVEADEVTYNLHILIRYELEVALLNGDLTPGDLPGAWNEKVKSYLGIDVPNDARGCLQDIHWSVGLIGYFPTYALGNLYSAQFVEAAEKELGSFEEILRKEEPLVIRDWFRKNVHSQGRRFTPADLVQRVTGQAPSADALALHLSNKISSLYGVKL